MSRHPVVIRGARQPSGGLRGFSLVEMMIALFILAVSVLGLTSLTVTAMHTNLQNDMRNAAVRITNETAENFFALPFAGLASGSAIRTVRLRSATKDFTVSWAVDPQTTDLVEIVITVSYDFRGQTMRNRTIIYKHRTT